MERKVFEWMGIISMLEHAEEVDDDILVDRIEKAIPAELNMLTSVNIELTSEEEAKVAQAEANLDETLDDDVDLDDIDDGRPDANWGGYVQ